MFVVRATFVPIVVAIAFFVVAVMVNVAKVIVQIAKGVMIAVNAIQKSQDPVLNFLNKSQSFGKPQDCSTS